MPFDSVQSGAGHVLPSLLLANLPESGMLMKKQIAALTAYMRKLLVILNALRKHRTPGDT